jgi:UDP-N-acetylmuramate dehydrogenase
LELQIQQQVSLAHLTSWKVGGKADFFCLPKNINEVIEAVEWANNKKLKITILSGGTNVLISDFGIEGLVICLTYFNKLYSEIKDNKLFLHAEAGCSKSELLKFFLKNKLAPALFLAGLPGDVGSGIVMNAGVGEAIEPREFSEIVYEFQVLHTETLRIKKFSKEEINWSYRHSSGWQPGIITSVSMCWPIVPKDNILEEVKLANKNRLHKQPLELPNCGSVFMNPEGYKSAKLIDEAGLKGFSIGGAQVSVKHANFIVNTGNATAIEINELIEYIKKVINEKAGVLLKTEVIYLGKW